MIKTTSAGFFFFAAIIVFWTFFCPGSVSAAQPQVSPELGRFFGAVQSGNIDEASSALRNVNVNDQASDGTCALHIAVQAKNPAMVDFLLNQGADHSLRNSLNMVPLHLCSGGNDVESARYLIRVGADVNAKGFSPPDGPSESTALILASEGGAYELVAFLIENGANINYVNNFNRTALFWAKKAGKKDVADFLESKGAVTDIDEARELSEKFNTGASSSSVKPSSESVETKTDGEESTTSGSGDGDSGEIESASSDSNDTESASSDSGETESASSDSNDTESASSDSNESEEPSTDRSSTNSEYVSSKSGSDSNDNDSNWEVEQEVDKSEPELSRDPDVLTKQGIQARKDGDFQEARKLLEAAVAIDGAKLLARAHLCLAYLSLKQRKQAMAQYKVVKEMSPKAAEKLRKALQKSKDKDKEK